MSKTLQECQTEVNDWVSKRPPGYWNPHQIFTRLTSEVGEKDRFPMVEPPK